MVNYRIIFFELLECEIKYKDENSQTSQDKYIFIPKERYHIPMYLNERKVEVGDIQKYTFYEKIDQIPYKVDLKTLQKYESRIGNERVVRKY